MVRNEERTKIRSLAAKDLKNFIQSRSTEMKKGNLFVSKSCRLHYNKLVHHEADLQSRFNKNKSPPLFSNTMRAAL